MFLGSSLFNFTGAGLCEPTQVDTFSCLKPCSGLIVTSFAKSEQHKDLDTLFLFMVTAEKLSELANMLRKLCKIENFWEVHEGADSGKISFKVYNY